MFLEQFPLIQVVELFFQFPNTLKFSLNIEWITYCNSNTYCNCTICNIQLKQQSPINAWISCQLVWGVLFIDYVQNRFLRKPQANIASFVYNILLLSINDSVSNRATILKIRSELCKVKARLTVPSNLREVHWKRFVWRGFKKSKCYKDVWAH